MALDLVTITGTILDAAGNGVLNAVIRLSPAPLSVDSPVAKLGAGIVIDPVEVQTISNGTFEITALQGFSYRLEIPSIGLDEAFVAPLLDEITFDLLGLVPQVVSAKDYTDDAGDPHVLVEVSVERIDTVLQRFTHLLVQGSVTVGGPWLYVGDPIVLLNGTDRYSVTDDAPTAYYRAFYVKLSADIVDGDVAGPIAVTDILTTDTLLSVTGADDVDLTDEFSIASDGIIDNTGGSDTSGTDLTVTWFGDESIASDPLLGTLFREALAISIDELLKVYLFGLDLTGDDGSPYPLIMYEWYIKAATKWLEHYLDIKIIAEDIVDEIQDHYASDWSHWGYFQLQNYPVSRVDRVELRLPSMTSGVVFDLSWVVLEDGGAHGVLQIVPGQGSIADILMMPGYLLPTLTSSWGRIPGAWHFDYRTGFEPGEMPFDIKHAIGMVASLGVMNVAGDLVGGSGLQGWSVGLPGLSQSVTTTNSSTNAGFGARIIQYKQDVKGMLPALKDFYGKRMKLVVA